jgi:hypothetical protein
MLKDSQQAARGPKIQGLAALSGWVGLGGWMVATSEDLLAGYPCFLSGFRCVRYGSGWSKVRVLGALAGSGSSLNSSANVLACSRCVLKCFRASSGVLRKRSDMLPRWSGALRRRSGVLGKCAVPLPHGRHEFAVSINTSTKRPSRINRLGRLYVEQPSWLFRS